jgi:AcrR family transcriptional regulator
MYHSCTKNEILEVKKADQSAVTREALLRAARQVFAERGYGESNTREISERAGVTRGALYYLYRDKAALFREVMERVARERVDRSRRGAGPHEDPWEAFRAGCQAALEAWGDPAAERILQRDGSTVVGWETCWEIDAAPTLADLVAGLGRLVDAGLIDDQPVEPLARLLLGALQGAGTAIARSRDPAAALTHFGVALDALLRGLLRSNRGSPAAPAPA